MSDVNKSELVVNFTNVEIPEPAMTALESARVKALADVQHLVPGLKHIGASDEHIKALGDFQANQAQKEYEAKRDGDILCQLSEVISSSATNEDEKMIAQEWTSTYQDHRTQLIEAHNDILAEAELHKTKTPTVHEFVTKLISRSHRGFVVETTGEFDQGSPVLGVTENIFGPMYVHNEMLYPQRATVEQVLKKIGALPEKGSLETYRSIEPNVTAEPNKPSRISTSEYSIVHNVPTKWDGVTANINLGTLYVSLKFSEKVVEKLIDFPKI